jgi:DNA-binding CsgD family transcriptional regulator
MNKKTNQKKSKEIKRNYDFSKYDLNNTDKQVLIRKLEGKQQTIIAKELKLTESTISTICNKPQFLIAYKDFNKSFIEKIIEVKGEATDIYLNILRDNKTPVKIRANICEKILQIDKIALTKENIEFPEDLHSLSDSEIDELYKKVIRNK